MTKEEAVKLVKEVTGMSLDWDDAHYEALQMAIGALEREPCEDAISREDAMFLIAHYRNEIRHEAMDDIKASMIKLPSVTPKQKWIPVSEKMPEEHEWVGTKRFGTTMSNEVYVTFETPKGDRFTKHLSFQNGKLSLADQQRINAFYKGSVPVAWMPLPDPYTAESEVQE